MTKPHTADEDDQEDSELQGGSSCGRHWVPTAVLAVLSMISLILIDGVEIIGPKTGTVEVRCKRIAIVGGGIAGLGAAYALTSSPDFDYDVTVFETKQRWGGNAISAYYEGRAVEMALTTYSQYHNFDALLDNLNMSTTFGGSGLTVASEAPNGTIRKYTTSLMGSDHLRSQYMNFEEEISKLRHLLERIADTWTEEEQMTTTLEMLLNRHNFTSDFKNIYLEACLQTYVTLSVSLLDVPIPFFRQVDSIFNLCISAGATPFQYFPNGSSVYVGKLRDLLQQRGVHLKGGHNVTAVRTSEGVGSSVHLLVDDNVTRELESDFQWSEFDQVVFASPRRDTYRILTHDSSKIPNAPTIYSHALGDKSSTTTLRYMEGNSTAHYDVDLVKRRLAPFYDVNESCYYGEVYNYFGRDNASIAGCPRFGTCRMSFDKTINHRRCKKELLPPFITGASEQCPTPPEMQLDPSKVIASELVAHPAHDVNFFRASRALHAVQGWGSMYFAGGDAIGFNFHEHSYVSGLIVAHAMGAEYPHDHLSLSRAVFMKQRNWLLYGLNPFVYTTVRRQDEQERCHRCL